MHLQISAALPLAMCTCNVSCPGSGGLQNVLYGDTQSRLQNFDHLYTSKSAILWPINTPICRKKTLTQFAKNLALFWPNFPKFIQFCKLGTLGLERKPTHRYTKNYKKKHLLAFEHPRIPSTIEYPRVSYKMPYHIWKTTQEQELQQINEAFSLIRFNQVK